MNPLLNELILANRLGTLQEAKAAQDQIKFSGLFKLEQYVKELKTALESMPTYTITAYPGDVIAGVQIHQSAGAKGLSIETTAPSGIDITGSYLHGTTLTSHNNIDVTVTLPQGLLANDKEFQNYTYFDKKAMYVSAIATHLKHFGDLKFSNLFLTHEPNDPLKPIIIIQPTQGVDREVNKDKKQIPLTPYKGMLNKAVIIIHFATPVNAIALRKLAPNRNNVKMLEHQNYIDHTEDVKTHRLTTTSLGETMSIPNIAPTPYYNHQIVQDMLAVSQSYTQMTILQQCPNLQYITCAVKVWLKLRGLYLDVNHSAVQFVKQSEKLYTLCNTAQDIALSTEYNNLLQQPNAQQFLSVYQKTAVYYHYTSHYHNNNHQYGFTGATLSQVLINLFLSKKITMHTNIQQGMDQFFRYILTHYPDNLNAPPSHTFLPIAHNTMNKTHENNNLMLSPLVLPPDFDASLTLTVLEQSQQDYSAIYQQSGGDLTPAIFYHSFDVVLLDSNNIYNVLYNTMSTQLWHQIQWQALLSLKTIYGNNMGSLLSHDVTAALLINNYALILQHAQLTPMTDEEIFNCVYMTRLNSRIQYNPGSESRAAFDEYLKEIHQLYLDQVEMMVKQNVSNELTLLSVDQQLSWDGGEVEMGDDEENIAKRYDAVRDKYLLLQQQMTEYNHDTTLLQYDHCYEVSLPVNYLPFYPVVNSYLHTKRSLYQSVMKKPAAAAPVAAKGKKATTTTTSTAVSVDDNFLQKEALIKVNMLLNEVLPLYIPNVNSDHIKNGTDKHMKNYTTFNKFRNKKYTTTTYGTGEVQTPEQLQADGDIAKYIPTPHQPTRPTFYGITQRLTNILLHSLTNRYYSLYISPRTNNTLTALSWSVFINFNPHEASRSLDKGPFAEQSLKCKEWRAWWGGSKSELRRFPDGSILEAVVWNNSPLAAPLTHDQVVFNIIQYITPLHIFTTNTAALDAHYFYSNKCTITTIAHPLGAFLQYKTDQHLTDLYCDPQTSPIIADNIFPNNYQFNNANHAQLQKSGLLDKLVSPSVPIPAALMEAYGSLNTMFREMKSLPLGVDSVQCTSAFLRGTSPFYPQQHVFDLFNPPTVDNINHFFASLPHAEALAPSNAITTETNHEQYNNINNHYIYEPINILLNLGTSSKWPQNDLLAISRVKTAFYLKLASIIRTEYQDGSIRRSNTFEEAHARANNKHVDDKNNNKENKKKNKKNDQSAQSAADAPVAAGTGGNVGRIYCQVTPYYVDVYLNGYVFRCRIVVPNENATFRSLTQSRGTIPPLALGDGLYKAFEREYVHRPKHHELIKNLTSTYPIYTLATKLTKRWFDAHFVTRHFSIEMCELLVASVFVNPAPFVAPTTLHAALLRVFYRLKNWDFENKPLIIPNISFVGGVNDALTLKKGTNVSLFTQQLVDIPLLLQHHKHDLSFDAAQYETDIHIDMLPQIYGQFFKRSRDNSNPLIYTVTSYDRESRAWSLRPNNALVYQHHLDAVVNKQTQFDQSNAKSPADQMVYNMLTATERAAREQEEQEQKEREELEKMQKAMLHGDSEDEDNIFVSLDSAQEQQHKQEQQQLYRQYYLSLIDRGDDFRYANNVAQQVTAINYNDLVQIQLLSTAALSAFTTLFHFTAQYNAAPTIHLQQMPQQRQSGFNKENFPMKTPQHWVFKHFLAMFKPQLSKYDAFIVLDPNVFTTDRMATSIWMYKNKNNNTNNKNNTTKTTKQSQALQKQLQQFGEYINFIARSTKSPEVYALIAQAQNRQAKTKQPKYKLPPDLALKLQQEEEAKRESQDKNGVDPDIRYTMFVGVDFVEQYLQELRGKFGQIASFYSNHQYGDRIICIKFHSFITDAVAPNAQHVYTLQQIQNRIQKSCAYAKNKGSEAIRDINAPDDHVLHPVQQGLHLLGLAPKTKEEKSKGKKVNKITTLIPSLQDFVKQMATLGSGLIQQVYIGHDDLIENVDF